MAKASNITLTLAAVDRMTHVINRAVDNGIKKFEALQKKADGIAKASFNVASGAGAIGLATGAVLAAPIKAFSEAEDAATSLKVTMMDSAGQVSKDFAAINKLATDLGGKLPGTTADFQRMMAKLVQQGISTKAILGGVGKAAAYIGVQMKMPFEEAAEFAAKLQDATKTTEADMLGLMDVIQKSYYLGVDKSNMLQGFSKMSAAMDIIKLKGLEGSKAIAPLLIMADQAAIAGEAAGNAYRKVFSAVFKADKLKEVNSILSAKGIQGLTFTKGGEFLGVENLLTQLEKLKGLDTETRLSLLEKLFGTDSETYQVLTVMMEKGLDGYKQTMAKMQAQADLNARVNAQLATLANLWEAATGMFTNILSSIGGLMEPELKATIDWMQKAGEAMGVWIKENPKLAKGIALSVAAFGALALSISAASFAFGGIMKIIAFLPSAKAISDAVFVMQYRWLQLSQFITSKAIPVMRALFLVLGNGIRAIGMAISANPIGAIIAGVAIAALLIYQYWEPISAFFIKLWADVKAIFEGFWSWLASLGGEFFNAGANIVQTIADGIMSGIGAVTGAIGKVTEAARAYLPFSPAKEGAFKDLHRVKIVETIAGAMNPAPLRNAMAGATMGAMAASPVATPAIAGGGAGGVVVNYSPVVNLGGAATEQDRQSFSAMLKQHERELMRMIRNASDRERNISYL